MCNFKYIIIASRLSDVILNYGNQFHLLYWLKRRKLNSVKIGGKDKHFIQVIN